MRDGREKNGKNDTLVALADGSGRAKKRRPYERPTVLAVSENELLESIGPAQGYGGLQDGSCSGSVLC